MDERVYILRFVDCAALADAWMVVSARADVSSCVIETQQCQLRLMAPIKSANALVERIYLRGKLKWCSRHALSAT